MSAFGTFDADLDLTTESATGNYSFNLKMADLFITSASFLVADYQPPAFEVNLDRLGDVVAGQAFDSTVRAAYYFGQPLANAVVHWQVSAEPFAFQWPNDPTFRFGDADQQQQPPRALSRPANAPRAEGAGKTGLDGVFAFQVPTDLSQDLASQRFTIEATVTDPDHGEVSNRQSVVVHKAGLYLGLKPSTFVAQANRPQTIELVTLDTQGGARADTSVHGQILRRRWLSVHERDAQGELHWTSRPEDTPVDSFDAHTGADGRGSFTFIPSEGGEHAWGASSTVATAGEVAAADTTTEVVDVAGAVDHQRGELRVDVAPSLTAAMRASLRQVEEYRYECLEQTVSRFLPRLALERAIDGLGLGDPLNLKADLPGLVTRSIQRMYRFQHVDGGWGWWQDDVSQPYLTAYALFGLIEARRAGFGVDQGVVDRGTTFLRTWLNGDRGPFGLDTRAYVVYVLGQAGAPDPARAAALFDRRADLGPAARGYLAQALAEMNSSDGRVGGLLAELTNQAVVSATGSHWAEASPAIKPWIMGTDVRTTAGVLDALVRLRPDHPLVTSAVRWLMAARRDGGAWETTHDSAMSLVTLTDYLSRSGELSQGSFTWQVGLNGTPKQNGLVADVASRVSASQLVMPMAELKVGQNHVDLLRSIGAGRLYYTLQLKTFGQGEDVPFESHGFSVAREYLAPNAAADAAALSQVHAGDLVQVRLTVVAPSDLQDVLIEDPLPAGLEPIDTRLKTTSLAVADAVQAATADAKRTATADAKGTATADAKRTATAGANRTAQGPGWQPWSHVDVRSDRVALFATYLGKGAYQYVYLARASLPGEYRVLPTDGREQYFPEVNARADGRRFTVLP